MLLRTRDRTDADRAATPARALATRARSVVRALLAPVRWTDLHRALAAQAPFEGCSRAEIRHLLRVGDVCDVRAGGVLCREDRIGYWLFVVLRGSVGLSRRGRWRASLGPGGHVGALAIVGFGPQPHTAVAMVDTTVFVLGRREVLDASQNLPSLQAALFPDVPAGGHGGAVRAMREEGGAAWKRVPPRAARRAAQDPAEGRLPASFRQAPRRPARADSPFGLAMHGPALVRPAARPLDRRVVAAAAVAGLSAIALLGTTFHPGVLVVRPSAPIDVTGDVEVEGLTVRPATGRYILTAVDIAEPHLFGLAAAILHGEQRLPAGGDGTDGEDRRGREQFRASQQLAVRVMASRAGVDPASVRVHFRDRRLTGPSAGLVYALVLADMAGQLTLPPGRVVAATGVLRDDQGVGPVGWVVLKGRVAASARADVFLVPAGTRSPGAVPVASFDEALRRAAA